MKEEIKEKKKEKRFVIDPYIPFSLFAMALLSVNVLIAPEPCMIRWLGALVVLFTGLWGVHLMDVRKGGYINVPDRLLNIEGTVFLCSGISLAVILALVYNPYVLIFIAVGAFFAIAYNLELFGGILHDREGKGYGYIVFGIAWGFIPAYATSLLLHDYSIGTFVLSIGWMLFVIPILRLYEASKPVSHELMKGIDNPGDGPDERVTKEWILTAVLQMILALWVIAASFGIRYLV